MKNAVFIFKILVCFSVCNYAMQSRVTGMFFNGLSQAVQMYLKPTSYVEVLPGEEIVLWNVEEFKIHVPSNRQEAWIRSEEYFYSHIYYDCALKPHLITFERIQNFTIPINRATDKQEPISDETRAFLNDKYLLISQYNLEK